MKQVNYNFEGAVALVTGAAQGMGLATAKAIRFSTLNRYAGPWNVSRGIYWSI